MGGQDSFKTRALPTKTLNSAKSELLKEAYARLERSKRIGAHIESIAIIETLMSERLETLESIKLGAPSKVNTLGKLLEIIKKYDALSPELHENLVSWSKSRNLAIHRLVKITNADEVSWQSRMVFIRQTSKEGQVLLKELKKQIDRILRENKRRLDEL